jgi:hypothetical protein
MTAAVVAAVEGQRLWQTRQREGKGREEAREGAEHDAQEKRTSTGLGSDAMGCVLRVCVALLDLGLHGECNPAGSQRKQAAAAPKGKTLSGGQPSLSIFADAANNNHARELTAEERTRSQSLRSTPHNHFGCRRVRTERARHEKARNRTATATRTEDWKTMEEMGTLRGTRNESARPA